MMFLIGFASALLILVLLGLGCAGVCVNDDGRHW
jgi:hypothetical protein